MCPWGLDRILNCVCVCVGGSCLYLKKYWEWGDNVRGVFELMKVSVGWLVHGGVGLHRGSCLVNLHLVVFSKDVSMCVHILV